MTGFAVKAEAETDPSHGTPPGERGTEELISCGVVNLDKPEGPSSHQVSAWVREMLGLEKAAHAGTLDPQVSGVLPLGLGDGTRALEGLSRADKTYVALMHLHEDPEDGEIDAVAERFTGRIFQKPPLKSAVRRRRRVREVYELEAPEIRGRSVLLSVDCEAGTYIRKLCHDFGRALLTGAHMQDLRRTTVGPFTEEGSVTLHDLKDAYEFYRKEGREKELREVIQPIERMFDHLPWMLIRDTAVDALCHGADLAAPGVAELQNFEEGDAVAVMSLKEEAVALGKALASSDEVLQMEDGLVVETSSVFMDTGTYPKGWS